jgi:type II secretory pathway pseudopilin PulG
MKARSSGRRGFTLVAVMVLMTLVGGVITVMAFNAAYFYRSQKVERSRCVLRAVTESAAAYAQMHHPSEPIELNMNALTPRDAESSIKIEVSTTPAGSVCHLISQLTWGSTHLENEMDFILNPRATTLPASK